MLENFFGIFMTVWKLTRIKCVVVNVQRTTNGDGENLFYKIHFNKFVS